MADEPLTPPLGEGRTDAHSVAEAPPTHAEMQMPIELPTQTYLSENGGHVVVETLHPDGRVEYAHTPASQWTGGDYAPGRVDWPTSEETSAAVASIAGRLLAHSNPLRMGSRYHGDIIKITGADGPMLDKLERVAELLQPFFDDVASVAGSCLTQAPDHAG